jgi:hypothetical protein
MVRAENLILLAVIGILVSPFGESVIMGQDSHEDSSVLLVVHQQSELQDTSRSPAIKLRSGTVVIGLRSEPFGAQSRAGWRVATLDEPPRYGWVRVGGVSTVNARVKQLKATAKALRAVGSDGKQSLPELILTQENPAIQKAWREVSIAILENDGLPENERLPEPYFARAEIWASVNNYSDALRDYLTAIGYARNSNRDTLSYSEYFDKLYTVSEKLQNMPAPAAGVELDTYYAARKQYSLGNTHFFSGELQNALHRFENSVQLAPDQPLYWYFRAMTHHRLGDEQRAQYDALLGATFERQLSRSSRRSMNGALTRVQGELRIWLESYRLGSPSNYLLRKYKIRLDAATE